MKKILVSFILGLIALVLPSVTYAGTQHNASGFAWSSTIGWISFNSTNDHDSAVTGVQPSVSDYGVNFDYVTGDVVGYAWSSNIGWIQFGGLSGFPAGPGTQAVNAKVQGSGLVGWAKALSADGAGWDGWISLAGTGYGVSQVGSALAGYAWGSDVVGWISFDIASSSGSGEPPVTDGPDPNGPVMITGNVPQVSFDAKVSGASVNNSTTVSYGTDVSLVSTLSNLPSGTSCDVTKTSLGGTAFSAPSSFSTTTTIQTGIIVTPATYVYELACQNALRYSATRSVTFTMQPQQPGFSIGGPENITVRFLSGGSADSELKTVIPLATAFAGNVQVSLTGVSPSMHASTTILYSLGGSLFSANPPAVNVSSNGATTFKIRLSDEIQNACKSPNVPIACVDYYITLTAHATDPDDSMVADVTKVYKIIQRAASPTFTEI